MNSLGIPFVGTSIILEVESEPNWNAVASLRIAEKERKLGKRKEIRREYLLPNFDIAVLERRFSSSDWY